MNEKNLDLLNEWKFRLNKAQIGHYMASEKILRYKNILGIGSVIFSSLLSGLLLFDFNIHNSFKLKITLIILSILTATFTSLQTFFAPAEKAEIHKNRAIRYGNLKRKTELFSMTVKSDKELIKCLNDIEKQWSLIAEDSPVTPKSIRKNISEILKNDLEIKKYIKNNE